MKKPKKIMQPAADPITRPYIITVIVEHTYEKVIQATSLDDAESQARDLNIQDDNSCYLNTETQDPIVEPYEGD